MNCVSDNKGYSYPRKDNKNRQTLKSVSYRKNKGMIMIHKATTSCHVDKM